MFLNFIPRCFNLIVIVFLVITSQVVLAQDCINNYPQTTPNSRFVIHDDNTVTDTQTGLMWQRCVMGLSGENCSQGEAQTYNWREALDLHGQNFAGYSDWRIPNIKELQSIVERQCIEPAINMVVYPNTPNDKFWSSSPSFASRNEKAWIVDFLNGNSTDAYRDDDISLGFEYVRLVRDGH